LDLSIWSKLLRSFTFYFLNKENEILE
jgi:hypothetical protein